MLIVLIGTGRHFVFALLYEDTVASALVSAVVGCIDSRLQGSIVWHNEIVERFFNCWTCHRGERQGNSLSNVVIGEVSHGLTC